ncbi:Ig-like domain-containing protein, partial [Aeromonas salmonicida]
LNSIALDTASPTTIAKGNQKLIKAIGTYSDGSIIDISHSVTWSSSNTSIAVISSTGVLEGVSQGGVVISANYFEFQAEAMFLIEKTPSVVAAVGKGINIGSAGVDCIVDGNASSAYDFSCLSYRLGLVDFGWLPSITYITLSADFNRPVRKMTFYGYWRQIQYGSLGYWVVYGCYDVECKLKSALSDETLLNFGASINLSAVYLYPYYRLEFSRGPTNANGGSGSGNFSEIEFYF